ncbi:uncharacterized protein METZ01_LOCUS384354 [marine metagenome]|uniref:Uncharacterized protein n=1 Tax=marine metagenome TaxID=408172 RepID=A0A382UB40_9ZZZZ
MKNKYAVNDEYRSWMYGFFSSAGEN